MNKLTIVTSATSVLIAIGVVTAINLKGSTVPSSTIKYGLVGELKRESLPTTQLKTDSKPVLMVNTGKLRPAADSVYLMGEDVALAPRAMQPSAIPASPAPVWYIAQ